MKQADIVALMKGIAPVLAAQIEAATKPLIERLTDTTDRLTETGDRLAQAEQTIAELRAKAAEPPPAPPEVVITIDTPAVKQAITEAVATITIDPHDERVRAVIREECEAAAAALPAPEPGKSVTIEDVRPLILDVVGAELGTAAFAANLKTLAGEAAHAVVGLSPGASFGDAVKEACQIAAQAAVAELPPAVTVDGVMPAIVEKIDASIEAAIAQRVTLAIGLEGETVAGAIKAAVQAAVAELPPAVTVDDVMPAIVDAVAVKVQEAGKDVTKTIEAAAKNAAETAVAALPVPGKGDPGTSVEIDDVMPALAEIATGEARKAAVEAVQAIRIDPAAEPWASTIRNAATNAASIAAQEAVDALPPPEPGKSVTIEELRPVVAQAIDERLPGEVSKAVKALPAPQDGNDGVGIESLLIDRDGRLVVTKTDGGVIKLDRIVGEDGKPGLGFDDIEGEDQGRDYVIRFVRGEQKIEFKISKLTIADTYQGVWRPGDFKRGDVVTWGGSLFMAQRDSAAKPETNDDWRMIVKRGRDGVRKQYDSEAPRPQAKVTLK